MSNARRKLTRLTLATRRFGHVVSAHPSFRDKPGILHTKSGQNLALVSDKHHGFGRKIFVIFMQLLGCGRPHSAVVPRQIDGTALAVRRISEANGAGDREREVILYCRGHVVVEHAMMAEYRLDARGRSQFECIEDGPKAVMAHIRHRAPAEVVPAAENHMRVIRMIGSVRFGTQPQVPVES